MPSRSDLKETKCSLLWRKVQSYCLQERKNGFKQTGRSFRALKFVKGLGFNVSGSSRAELFLFNRWVFFGIKNSLMVAESKKQAQKIAYIVLLEIY